MVAEQPPYNAASSYFPITGPTAQQLLAPDQANGAAQHDIDGIGMDPGLLAVLPNLHTHDVTQIPGGNGHHGQLLAGISVPRQLATTHVQA